MMFIFSHIPLVDFFWFYLTHWLAILHLLWLVVSSRTLSG